MSKDLKLVNFISSWVQAMGEKNWELAVQLRGKSFQRNLETYRMLTRYLHITG